MPGLGQGFCNITKVQSIIGIVERLRLRSPGPVLAYRLGSLIQNHSARAGSKRLTVNPDLSGKPAAQPYNFRRKQSRTFRASPQTMEYDFSPLVGLPVLDQTGGTSLRSRDIKYLQLGSLQDQGMILPHQRYTETR